MKTVAAMALLLAALKILIIRLDGPHDDPPSHEDVSGWGTR